LYCWSYYTVVPPPIHDIVPVARFSLGSYFEKKLQFLGERDTAQKSELGYLIGRPVNPEKSCRVIGIVGFRTLQSAHVQEERLIL